MVLQHDLPLQLDRLPRSVPRADRRSAKSPFAISQLAVLACAALAAAPSAQGPVDTFPTGFVNGEGNSRHWVPGHFAPARAQTTYDASVIAAPTGNLSRLWLRADSNVTTGAMPGHRSLVTLHISSAGVPAPSHVLPESYVHNRGSDRLRVLDRAVVDFPNSTPNGLVAPWSITLPIQPFAYVAGRNLQLEWDIEDPNGGSSASAWFVDALDVSRRDGGGWFRRKRERDACPSSGTVYDGEVGGPGDLCSVWFYSLSGPDLPATTWFGVSETMWNGTPLPIDLAPYGFAGCAIATDLLIPFPGRTDASGTLGRYRIDVPIPFQTALAGVDLHTQTVVFDPSFGGGLRVSDGGKLHIGNWVGRLQARHLYSYRTTPTDQPEFLADVAPIVGWR